MFFAVFVAGGDFGIVDVVAGIAKEGYDEGNIGAGKMAVGLVLFPKLDPPKAPLSVFSDTLEKMLLLAGAGFDAVELLFTAGDLLYIVPVCREHNQRKKYIRIIFE